MDLSKFTFSKKDINVVILYYNKFCSQILSFFYYHIFTLKCFDYIGLKLLFWVQITIKELTILLMLSCHFLLQLMLRIITIIIIINEVTSLPLDS